MTKIKLLYTAIALLLVINIAMAAFIFFTKMPPPRNGRPQREVAGPRQMIIDRLHFNDDQVAAYEKMITIHQEAIIMLDERINQTKTGLYSTLNSNDEAGKAVYLTQLADLQKQVEATHYNHFVELRNLCHPGQLNDFEQLTRELSRYFATPGKNPPPPKD